MEETFFPFLLIPQQKAKNRSCNNSPSMAPVVDTGHQQTEDKDPQCPGTNLFINGLPVNSSPALAIVKGGPNQTAHRCRGTDGEGYAGKVRDPKANYPTQGVEDHHPMSPIFADDKGGNLTQGDHIEQDVEDAPM